jgi:hypothetical protein
MGEPFEVFTGNCPKSVSKEAKYAIRTRRGLPVVALVYATESGERLLATTQEHPDLVELVNAVKTRKGSAPNGPFYVNEYGQVLVPVVVGLDTIYYQADEYDLPLRFLFEGRVLSGEGLDLAGKPLVPGGIWVGPHPGIPYVLAAGQLDIYYVATVRPDVTRKVRLSTFVGAEAAAALAGRIRGVKGWKGGRFYINEWREMFAPLNKGATNEFRYIGHLDLDDPWFPKTRHPELDKEQP